MSVKRIKLFSSICVFSAVGLLVGCSEWTGNKNLQQGEFDYTHSEYGKAFPELLSAARAGNAKAQYAVGYMYYHGMGVSRNPELARYWMAKAAKQGNQSALNAVDLLNGDGSGTMIQPSGVHAYRPAPPKPKVEYTSQGAQQESYDNSTRVNNTVTSGTQLTKETHVAPPMSGSSDSLYESKSVYQTAEPTGSSGNDTHSSAKSVVQKPVQSAAATPAVTPTPAATLKSKHASAPTQPNYALQLFGDFNKANVQKFIQTKHLQASTAIHKTTNHGRPWYVALDGEYPSFAHAKNAMANLPVELQRLHPWIRPVNAS
ncbi:MAG: hypothetical protein A3F17_01620 [Gammaproteobacteria bacterium RIFCSPHIGHO2_12_FULL_41_15]|nr:MAG: hypothetical protein A3F17_01620 [Gammaproteobacteria bacterium RIFCSPHIGHO2_12_FULL_41_15]